MNDMAKLIEPLIPALRRYARGLLRDGHAADDLVQDGLERAIGHWHQRRPVSNVRSWLFAIVHNLALNQLRQSSRRGLHMPLDAAGDAMSGPPTQEHGLGHRDLVRALQALPEEQRRVVLLVSVEGLSYAEVAEMLRIPIGTVMSRLSRGREKLRIALEGKTEPGSFLHPRNPQ